ncbi:MAG TPA: MaoC/PaaZ C-terminal domain-containing protein [Candidatus Eisenbacteria bacterium]|nr:MaoC/PaaZ C-terminal domain-containing protein [Candidatus Eisenbacteria bacterium]
MQKDLYRRVGENRFRESVGLYYEDFEPGTTIEHRPGRTITEADNVWFTNLTMNPHPLHFDAHFAGHTEWKKPLVNSCLTLAMVTGMSVTSTSRNAVSNLGWDKVRLTAPVFVGDTIYAESTILSKRPSDTRPGQGVVTVETKGVKEDGTVFMTFERTFLVYTRAAAPHGSAGY